MALLNINLETSEDNICLLNDIVKMVFVVMCFHISMCVIYGGVPFYWGKSGGMGSNMFNDDFINVLISLAFSILAYNLIVRKIIKFESVEV